MLPNKTPVVGMAYIFLSCLPKDSYTHTPHKDYMLLPMLLVTLHNPKKSPIVKNTIYYTLYRNYTTLYYTILYYTILYYTILYYTALHYTTLHYTTLYYTILYHILIAWKSLVDTPQLEASLLLASIHSAGRCYAW
jgi:hypothetical protein